VDTYALVETAMKKPVRVLVANSPRLMRELILATLSDQPDIEVVGEVVNEADISESIEKTSPDVIVIAQDKLGDRPIICDAVLRQRPDIQIIAVAPHHNYSVHYWATLNIHSHPVEASEEALLGVLRTRAGSICGVT
jgi:chemotaxis response regulator CheB